MPNHGTTTCYSYHGCRCDLCREANRAYISRYRQTDTGRSKARKSTKLQTLIAVECRNYLRENDRAAYYQIVDEQRSRIADG
jgi:hypothetical protein